MNNSYLTNEELNQLNKYFNATNYLAVGQLYLLDNPLLKRKLELSDVKPRLVGHWGTIPGQNFLFTRSSGHSNCFPYCLTNAW